MPWLAPMKKQRLVSVSPDYVDDVPLDQLVAGVAQRDQIPTGVNADRGPLDNVMDLQILPTGTASAGPLVSVKDLLAECFIRLRREPDPAPFREGW